MLVEDMAYPKHTIIGFGMITDFCGCIINPGLRMYESIVMVSLVGVSLDIQFIYIVHRATPHASQM